MSGTSLETVLYPLHLNAVRPTALLALIVLSALFHTQAALAADNLRLAPGLSFTDDSSSTFPIEGDHLEDGVVTRGRAAIAFFGASHCWNTNREAERLVALYPRFRERISFVIVDVNHPSHAQRPLLAAHYHSAIPTLVVFAPSGAVLYERAGETASARGDTRALETLLNRAIGE
jgi:hypothetical protein